MTGYFDQWCIILGIIVILGGLYQSATWKMMTLIVLQSCSYLYIVLKHLPKIMQAVLYAALALRSGKTHED